MCSVWNDTLIQGIDVPADAVSSTGVNGVTVNGSNPVNFYVTCSDSSECSTGCCYYNQCADPAMCSGGLPGDLCSIASHPNCLLGPVYAPSGYECISDSGELPMDTPAGDDCRFCCRPGDVFNGLTCMANQGDCVGGVNDRGLYCGCTNDGQCGDPGTIGCGDMGGGTMCCTGRPSVDSVNPVNGETGVCTNRSVVVEFDHIMNKNTLNASNLRVVHDATGTVYAGAISSYIDSGHTFLEFAPDWMWASNAAFTITVVGDSNTSDGTAEGVLNQYGIGMNGNYVSHFTAGNTLCSIDHVEIDVSYMPGPTVNYDASQDLYTCQRDDCSDDMAGIVGNQHQYRATAVDGLGNPLLTGATYDWSGSSTNGVLNVDNSSIRNPYVGTVGPDGTEMIRVEVDLGEAGAGSAGVLGRVSACDSPWPSTTPYMYPGGAGVTEPTNFTTFYCREGGLPGMASPLINVNRTPTVSGEDEIMREVFFSTCNSDVASCSSANTSGDVIGIRVMENESFLSPSAWFNQKFPSDSGSCVPVATVDGYQACRAGRTIYVAATNLVNSPPWRLYPNIYLISYNEGANGQTVNIYNQMVQNWFFNSSPSSLMNSCAGSPTDTNKDCVVRDTKRVTDIGEIAYLLLNYQFYNGHFPELDAGTFLPGITNSKWPSWMARFGNEIGINPPTDPINEFYNASVNCVVPPYDPAGTCWNDTAHTFRCPANSRTYMYLNESSNTYLFTNLEYLGAGAYNSAAWPGRFFGMDPCSTPGSDCQCYNYWAPAYYLSNPVDFWITNWSPPS
jgi:hypothetical protein